MLKFTPEVDFSWDVLDLKALSLWNIILYIDWKIDTYFTIYLVESFVNVTQQA